MISRGLFLFQIALHTIMFLCLIRTALHASTLRVPVLDYAPYAFFNYLNPPVSIVIAAFWSRAVWQSDSTPDA